MKATQQMICGVLLSCLVVAPIPAKAAGVMIDYYRLRAPGDAGAIKQASDLHYGRFGARNGLWTACDRSGQESGGKIYFFSSEALAAARPGGKLIADDEFTFVDPREGWSAFAAANKGAGPEVIEDVRKRITLKTSDPFPVRAPAGAAGPQERPSSRPADPVNEVHPLDLEAITVGPSPRPPHEPRLFVVAEEPYSITLELTLEGGGSNGRARLMAIYGYDEPPEHQGTARNDGLEGLAWTGQIGRFYFAEEATRSHTANPKPPLMTRDPILGVGELKDGKLNPDAKLSETLTAAVRRCRQGPMQTLNALTVLADGRVLAVDRNGGLVLRVDPAQGTAEPWLDLYDLGGKNLRELLADFPEHRTLPYISIEGIALDEAGSVWLVDDPAIPEGWRESCVVRITGVKP